MPSSIIIENDLGRGVDQYHPELKLQPGFVPQVSNFLPQYNGSLTKRRGFQRVGGWLPIRIERVQLVGSTLHCTINSYFSLPALTPGPIAIRARVIPDAANVQNIGDFNTTATTWWYSSWSLVSANVFAVATTATTGATDTYQLGTASNQTSTYIGIDAWVWGFDPAALVSDVDATRQTWITSVTPYQTPTQDSLVATYFGNVHYLDPTQTQSTAINSRMTASAAIVLGPAIFDSVPVTPPARGYIADPLGVDNRLPVTSIVYNAGPQTTTYTLTGSNLQLSGAITSIIRPGVDLLTVVGTSHAALAGEFAIVSVTQSGQSIAVECTNAANAALDAQVSDSVASAYGAVYTDQLAVTGTVAPAAGAQVQFLSQVAQQPDVTVVAGTTTSLALDGVSAVTSIPSGDALYITQTSAVLPVASVTGFVPGDVVSILQSGSTPAGIVQPASYTREFVVQAVGTSTITVDEAVPTCSGTVVEVTQRWVVASSPDPLQRRASPAIIAPYRMWDQTSSTTDPSQAPFPSTAQIGGSVYITDYYNPVQKFDGLHTYRAGLPRWNPLIALDVHQDSPTLIGNPFSPAAATTDSSDSYNCTVTCSNVSDASKFTAGDTIVVVFQDGNTPPNTIAQWPGVVKSSDGTTTGNVVLTVPNPTGLTGACVIYQQMALRYYFRYSATDRNGKVTVSPAVASQDALVTVGQPSVVSMRLTEFPVFDATNYTNINLQIYRTGEDTSGSTPVVDGSPPFYQVTALPVTYASILPVAQTTPLMAYSRVSEFYEDSTQVTSINSNAVDTVATALTSTTTEGQTSVGATWEEPPRAKYALAINNSLVLANIKSWPELYLSLRESPTQTPSAWTTALAHQTKLILRRGGSTSQVTDASTTQVYELNDIELAASSQILSGAYISSWTGNLVTFTATGSLPSGVTANSWVQLLSVKGNSGAVSHGGIDLYGWYQVLATGTGSAPGTSTVTVFAAEAIHVVPQSVASNTITTTTPHGLAVGSPVVVQGTNISPQLQLGVQYYAIPVTATSLQLASSLANAQTGTPITITALGTPADWSLELTYFSAEPGHSPEQWEGNAILFASNSVDIPVALINDPNLQIIGQYYATGLSTSSVLLQRTVDALSKAINSVHAGSQQSGASQTGTSSYWNQSWIGADSGADYPASCLYLRSPTQYPFTVEFQNTVDGQGRQKFLAFAGEYAIPNLSFGPAAVNTATSTVSVPNHGLSTGQLVHFETTGTAPGGLSIGTEYQISVLNATQFTFATTGGTPVSLTSQGTGSHSLTALTQSQEQTFPSRLVVSYPNYPEIFDSPFVAVGGTSDSVIDVNPDDGQEIRAIIPFNGDSFTKASLQEARVVVFKDINVYMVNTQTYEVDQIETLGHGCSFPRSVRDTKSGIMYADRQGLYKIDRSSNWSYQGQILGRVWTQLIGASDCPDDIPVAIHSARNNQYLVSIPSAGSDVADTALAYDHTREIILSGIFSTTPIVGSWTQLDGLNVASWANWSGLDYYGDRSGRVLGERAAGDATDYRDDSSPIAATVRLRAMDFGQPGSRKLLRRVVIAFRNDSGVTRDDISVFASIEGRQYSLPLDGFELKFSSTSDDLSDTINQYEWSLSFSVPERKADYFQISIQAAGMDQPVEITQLSYIVDLLSPHGVLQAAATTSQGT